MSCGCNGPGDPIKPQGIRILDVWLIGPLMLYASTLLPKEKDLTRFALRSFGLGTIVYNARNYMVIKERNAAQAMRPGGPQTLPETMPENAG
jgi:hypothetical protein